LYSHISTGVRIACVNSTFSTRSPAWPMELERHRSRSLNLLGCADDGLGKRRAEGTNGNAMRRNCRRNEDGGLKIKTAAHNNFERELFVEPLFAKPFGRAMRV